MLVDVFLDTNILVYAHDKNAGHKHDKAKKLVEGYWVRREVPAVSVQVLQELHVNLVRKSVPIAESAQIATRYLSWRVLDITRRLFRDALVLQDKRKLSYWDSLIIAAASQAGASRLLSEDLSAGQRFGSLTVENPLV